MANQFTKYTGNVTGQAGSLITALDAALVTGQGWTKTAGTNEAAYRAPSGNRLYLYVNDTAVVTAKEARITGYETVASVGPISGTNPFPTAAQNPAGNGVACMVARKSVSADSTARAYQIYADTRTVYMFIQAADSAGYYESWMFGEIYSLVGGDAWNTMIIGRSLENSTNINAEYLDVLQATGVTATTANHYLARAYNALPTANGSLVVGVHGDGIKSNLSVLGLMGSVPFPNPPDGGLYVSPIWTNEASGVLRGRMRGFWQVLHPPASFSDGDTFTGTGDLAAKTFAIIKYSARGGCFCLETSATLEAN